MLIIPAILTAVSTSSLQAIIIITTLIIWINSDIKEYNPCRNLLNNNKIISAYLVVVILLIIILVVVMLKVIAAITFKKLSFKNTSVGTIAQTTATIYPTSITKSTLIIIILVKIIIIKYCFKVIVWTEILIVKIA